LDYWDPDRLVPRRIGLDFSQHGERPGFIQKVLDVCGASMNKRRPLSGQAWVQEFAPVEGKPWTCGWAHIIAFGVCLVAEIATDDNTRTDHVTEPHTYPWSDFIGYWIDLYAGVVYLKFRPERGLGIIFKSEHPNEWATELKSHDLAMDESSRKQDWMVRL
jgi:hypothetical protein